MSLVRRPKPRPQRKPTRKICRPARRAPARRGETLPAWNLADLYRGVDDPQIRADLTAALDRAQSFHDQHSGRLLAGANPDAAVLADALREYEAMLEPAAKAMVYAQLLHAADMGDPRHGGLVAMVAQQFTEIRARLMFFELEWMDVADDVAQRLLDDPRLAFRRHFLATTRRFRPHKLSEAEEQVVNQLANTGSRSWQRFFEEFTAEQKFDLRLNGRVRRLGQSETLALLYDGSRARRKAAADALTAGLRSNARILGYVLNTLLWDQQIDDQMRRYPHPMAARNLDNLIDERTVEALLSSVEEGYPIVQRYYRLKSRLLKIRRLADYDRYAPIASKAATATWSDARQRVLDSFRAFSPELERIAAEFFEQRWIDAQLRPNKAGGAFSAPTVPSAHAYILMNYTGKLRDVMTLAHELGHGVHQQLSRPHGLLQSSTPLTLAETASVFAEMLLFERLMAEQSDPRVKLGLLCNKLEDTFATVFRQTAMTRFEQQVHAARRDEGELPIDEINRHWLETNRAMFADTVELTDGYGWWWSYIGHFVRSPFYCYAYAFGELLVIALVQMYREQGAAFVPRYVALLSAGGSGTPDELLAPLGVDVRQPTFWKKGLAVIDGMVSQAEALARELGYRT
ncbi:MAG: Oligoendopeptidase F, plasmid [Phycisphaerae bacterium]|nr:Oligoendopeptidase F, plasmid [Phycisphaerae bacterium]